MSIRQTVSSLLTAPLAALVETQVQQISEQMLAAQDVATRESLGELKSELSHVRTALSEMDTRLATLRDELGKMDGGESGVAETLSELAATDRKLNTRAGDLASSIQLLNDELMSVQESLTGVEKKISKAESAGGQAADVAAVAEAKVVAKAPAPTGDKGCKVEGCTSKHRARGFCGKHYQMWQRSTLPGFVNKDGSVFLEEEGPRWQLDPKASGQPVTVDGGRLYLAGKLVDAVLIDA